ncbi:MAG: amidohydrolase family protein [Gemmatimonadaceae bacterium]
MFLIDGDRISAVGGMRAGIGDQVIDGHGLVLAPGLIDTQSRLDRGVLTHGDVLEAARQGITSVVIGGSGESVHPLQPLFDSLRRSPTLVNVASYAGHLSLRAAVLGGDSGRVATPAELTLMRAALSQDLGAGALGLSSALGLDSAGDAAVPELIELARLAADSAARFSGAIRSDRMGAAGIDQLVRIARDARIPATAFWSTRRDSLASSGDSLTAALDRARASGLEVTAAVCVAAQAGFSRIVEWPPTVLCSGESQHTHYVPSFISELARIARNRRTLSLEAVIQKSTSLAAAMMGLRDRGAILPGQFADLVLFEEGMLSAPPSGSSIASPLGIRAVWVNGVLVYRNGQATGAHPGRVLGCGGVSPIR